MELCPFKESGECIFCFYMENYSLVLKCHYSVLDDGGNAKVINVRTECPRYGVMVLSDG